MENYLYRDLFQLENTHWWHIAKRRTALALLQPRVARGAKILDLGCGTGQNLISLAALGTTWGVDIELEALRWCRQRGLRNVKKGTAYALPFADQSLDIVTLFDVLEHTNEDRTLAEVRRVLKPGGLILLTVPAYQWLWSRWDKVLHHRKRYNRTDLSAALIRHGLAPVTMSYAYSFLLLPVWLVRQLKSRFSSEKYSSDFRLGSPWVNSLMGKLADCERPLIQRGHLPFGTSIFALARKT